MDMLCAICKKPGSSSTGMIKIGDKGRKTLVLSSIEREDGLQETLESLEPLTIHSTCRKNYTRKNTILAVKRKSSSLAQEHEEEVPQLRSGVCTFDIKRDCMFCSEAIVVDIKTPNKRRKLVSHVETIEFRDTLLKHVEYKQDDWGNAVAERILPFFDLVAAEAKYHRHCAQTFFQDRDGKVEAVGRPKEHIREEAFNKLCLFLDENDECQHSVPELLEYMDSFLDGQDGYTMKYFKEKLQKHYGDDITITSIHGMSSIVSFRDSTYKILREKWNTDKVTDVNSENERIIDMAASIILDDIRMHVYNLEEYPTMEETDNGGNLIPQSLKRFMHNLVDRKCKRPEIANRRCIAIAHSIISACRPKSFVSPLLLGIALYIHRKYASRELIDILSSISFADDYKEVQRYENALISGGEPSYDLGGFTQFVFDNADFNVATLTGHNTFHTMGGIACVTPPGVVDCSPIKRTTTLPSTEAVGSFGHIAIKTYMKPTVPGLQSVVIKPLSEPENELLCLHRAVAIDSLWVAGYVLRLTPCPSWSGFMKLAVNSGQYETTRIETLPFIHLDPSNPNTIYTALCFAQEQCEKHSLRICPVTFDQPLYQKASEIVAASNDLEKIIVRLGGFHLLMSYLGSIGYIMAGSGLAELWERVYAKGSVGHMLTGHAFSRALRAHILTFTALICVLTKKPGCMDNIDKEHLGNLYKSILMQEQNATDVVNDECVKELHQVISKLLDEAASQSRTGKLWVQYIHQVTLLLNFLRAERIGDWSLHLHCVKKMIPHFHAAGHLPYAKSARLYLQQMEALGQSMPAEDYALFTDKGYFTIRRLDEFWSGNFSDQTIEQFLMRMLKSSGGMTHGRGITESTLTKWVHALPHCVPICDALEQFTGVHTATSEQHKDLRPSTQSKDKRHFDIFMQWLQAHTPFAAYKPDRLVSLSTGVVADESVNCDEAVKMGCALASQMDGKKFTDIKLHRNDKVKTIGTKQNTIKVRGQNTVINPTLLFNRITCVLNSSDEMEKFLGYELAPQPPSLFIDGVMRKPAKSALGVLLKSYITQESSIPENGLFVLDGGHLLQTVVWPQPSTYGGVCQAYISYTLKHYGVGATVVFDGYSSTTSTKVAEQKRRAQKVTSSDIIFDNNMPTTTSQAAFLANSNNKQRLIQNLREMMLLAGIHVKQAEADADELIVSTALSTAERERLPVTVVGTDTDLLVMLVARATPDTNVYMLCNSKPTTLYKIQEIQDSIGSTKNHLMFVHAITGCDTVSAIYGRGKRKAFNLVHRPTGEDNDMLYTFTNSESTHSQVQHVGEHFILKMYGACNFQSLDEYRHVAYKKAIGRSRLNSTFQLASLPPTSAAAKQHSFRTYHTVQAWMGNYMTPTEWGWKLQDNILTPVETELPLAPDNLLHMVSCGCKADGCGVSCGCRKLGVFCTSMCGKCNGQTCSNTAPSLLDNDSEEPTQLSADPDNEDGDETMI